MSGNVAPSTRLVLADSRSCEAQAAKETAEETLAKGNGDANELVELCELQARSKISMHEFTRS